MFKSIKARHLFKTATVFFAALVISATSSGAPKEFRADYELYRNGKLMGSSQISLSKSRGGYQFSTTSASEGGWASLLGGAKIKEISIFNLNGDDFQPVSYSYRQAVSVKTRKRDITFDWNKKWAREDDGDGVVNYLLEPGSLDRNLVVLALADDLRAKRTSLNHFVAYKGESVAWNFKDAGSEKVSTALGVIEANRIERVRDNKDRSTISWHAPKYDYLPVKIQQLEPNGDSIEMRLKRMDITTK